MCCRLGPESQGLSSATIASSSLPAGGQCPMCRAGEIDAVYSFSNMGSCVDIFAPGVDIFGACGGEGECSLWADQDVTWHAQAGLPFHAPLCCIALRLLFTANEDLHHRIADHHLAESSMAGKRQLLEPSGSHSSSLPSHLGISAHCRQQVLVSWTSQAHTCFMVLLVRTAFGHARELPDQRTILSCREVQRAE